MPRGHHGVGGLPDEVEVHVHDSAADIGYLVPPPLRPKGSVGTGGAELSKLVTRDSMIGVADALLAPPKV